MTFTVFVCQRGTAREPCVECGARAASACTFELGGRREGESCGRALCERCSAALGEHCGPHARLRDRRAAAGERRP